MQMRKRTLLTKSLGTSRMNTSMLYTVSAGSFITYGNHALTYMIVYRSFSQAPQKFTSYVERKMGYGDFAYFMLSEEDISSDPSLEYWVKCIDMDGNGVLTPWP
ncbi:hypothetical protein HRI_003543000 [Hibiscus trionum]|uniref:EF-hand domain-containing protein n=1 Tax=Hibiscus trionum TaxID=183268 RepID=A0A9W7IPI6_HIBTR|nr:hypothetical protein HRI_003543000 [Hibiscus trionum]